MSARVSHQAIRDEKSRVGVPIVLGHDTITLSEARSRLDQRRFSRPNTHFSAFFKPSKKITFSPANFANFCKSFAKIWQFLQKNFQNFAKSWEILQIVCKFACEKMIFLKILKNDEKCVFGRENRR